jgi:hypothetical protein
MLSIIPGDSLAGRSAGLCHSFRHCPGRSNESPAPGLSSPLEEGIIFPARCTWRARYAAPNHCRIPAKKCRPFNDLARLCGRDARANAFFRWSPDGNFPISEAVKKQAVTQCTWISPKSDERSIQGRFYSILLAFPDRANLITINPADV